MRKALGEYTGQQIRNAVVSVAMNSMNCANCPNHCCGKQDVTPILMPHEVSQFTDDERVLDGEVWRLRRLMFNGMCRFLDENQRCTIYDRRPLECRLYPWVMRWNHRARHLEFELHRGCPQRYESPLPAKILHDYGKLIGIGEDFWLKFEEAGM